MPGSVLVVEKSEAIRGIAESLLRQGGAEVLTAESAQAADQILEASDVSLLLVASDITAENGQPYFEKLGAGASSIPLVLLHDSMTGHGPDYPEEMTIQKPFTPADFMNKIAALSQGGIIESDLASVETSEADLSGDSVEEDIIDAALGLNQIEVDSSEVLNNDTGVFRKKNRKHTTEKMIGFDYKSKGDDDEPGSSSDEIEVMNVTDSELKEDDAAPATVSDEPEFLGSDSSKVKRAKKPPQDMSESSKLDIPTDQYSMIKAPEDFESGGKGKDSSGHDYDWFINELKKETEGSKKKKSEPEDLEIMPTSEGMDPSVKPTSGKSMPPSLSPNTPKSHKEAVDKFITEFKREIEKITDDSSVEHGHAASSKTAKPHGKGAVSAATAPSGDYSGDFHDMARRLIDVIAVRVAERILSRLQPEAIYAILKESLEEELKKLPRKS
jgi:DNA-binding response OmpR family regulator